MPTLRPSRRPVCFSTDDAMVDMTDAFQGGSSLTGTQADRTTGPPPVVDSEPTTGAGVDAGQAPGICPRADAATPVSPCGAVCRTMPGHDDPLLADEVRALIDAVKAFDHLCDDDGIFCIPSVNAEQAGAERLREYLQQVFAEEWNNQTITQLLQKEGLSSKKKE